MKKSIQLFFWSFIATTLFATQLLGKTTITSTYKNDTTRTITLKVNLKPNDFIIQNSIDFSVDHPDITLSSWKTDRPPTTRYVSTFKEEKKVFDQPFTFMLEATSKRPMVELNGVNLYLTYYLNSKKQNIQELLPLQTDAKVTKKSGPTIVKPLEIKKEIIATVKEKPVEEKKTTWSSRLSGLITNTQSIWLRIVLVLLLGLLMSLTPCIYPMVPITVGILQAQGSKSIFRNFLLAFVYTCGIATTFATMGLVAALTGQVFGGIMASPIFIGAVAVFLAYLGLSMFGLYDMYTPRFMRAGAEANAAGKSLLSIFIFGVASGTIASPCLSPGLVLLLSIVATMASKLLGFVLLFSFGIGLSIPLLIIGTFSSSLNALPRAGLWMVEIKKLFGFLLFGMVFYFLNNVLPWPVLLGLITLFLLVTGIAYFATVKKQDPPSVRTIKNVVGVSCIVLAVLFAAKTYQAAVYEKKIVDTLWYTDVNKAFDVAKREKKRLFLDIGTPFCSICKAIDRTLLQEPKVRAALTRFVCVKIDGASNEAFKDIQKKYTVVGFPTFLLIDQDNGNMLARWGGELYDVTPDEFVAQLAKH